MKRLSFAMILALTICPSMVYSQDVQPATPASVSVEAAQTKNVITVPLDGLTLEQACEQVADGGTIYLEMGTYTLSQTIELNRDITIRSKTTNVKDVEIRCERTVFTVTGSSPQFIGLTIHAKGENASGFWVKSGTPIIQSCHVTADQSTGLCISGEKSNPEIKSCHICNCGNAGVFVYDNGAGEFTNCEIYGNELTGIEVKTGASPKVTDCKIYDGKDAGVYIYDNGAGEFANCEIYGNAHAGIDVATSASPKVTDCKIYNGKQGGILVHDNGAGKFANCEICGNEFPGIEVKTGSSPKVADCKIYNGKDAGVYIHDNGAGKFTNCEIYGNARAGIVVTTGAFPKVTDCKIYDGKQGGVWIHDNGAGEFTNCEIYGNELPGIEVKTGASPKVTDCKIHDGKQNGVWIHDNGAGKFTNCEIYRNEFPGIEVTTGGSPKVIDCKIYDGKQNGVCILDNGSGEFTNCEIYGNAYPGIAVKTGGSLKVTNCKIHDGKSSGVYILDNGAGEFNDNTLSNNMLNGEESNWNIAITAENVTGNGNTPPLPIQQGKQAGDRMVKTVNGVEFTFRWCPAGTFTMGSPESEEGRFDNEAQHEVTIHHGFWLMETEVTQKQWKAVMETSPSHFEGDDLPVEQVSWNDCQEFCKKCQELGLPVCLPTEKQWEYACRAGSTGPYAGILDEMSWYGYFSNSPAMSTEKTTHPVGTKKANDWGFYDMHGNVWEWCADAYVKNHSMEVTDSEDSNRVNRGGSWYGDARSCRSANRHYSSPEERADSLGVRLAIQEQ